MWEADPPLHHSEGRVCLIMIWADNNHRAEEAKETWGEGDKAAVGGDRSIFHCVSFAPQQLSSTLPVMSSRLES